MYVRVMSVCHMWVVLKKPVVTVGGTRSLKFWEPNLGPLKKSNAVNPGSAIPSSQHL